MSDRARLCGFEVSHDQTTAAAGDSEVFVRVYGHRRGAKAGLLHSTRGSALPGSMSQVRAFWPVPQDQARRNQGVEPVEEGEGMSDRIEFFISGTPKSWKAPQFNKKTGAAYKGKQEKVWRESIWGQAMPHAPETPWTGPVHISLVFQFLIPKSWPKWKREYVLTHQCYPDGGPDYINLAKAFEDALKGIFFVDDRQIAWGRIFKKYVANNPGVRVELSRLPGIPDKKPKEAKDGA